MVFLELHDIKYFIAAIDHKSVSKAAASIPVSAGSISKAISRIEDEVGSLLFFRKGRGIEPTDVGLKLASDLRSVNMQLESALHQASAPGKIGGEIRAVGTEFLIWSQAPKLVKAAARVAPQSRLTLRTTTSDAATLELVHERSAHLGVVSTPPSKGTESLRQERIPFATAAHHKHPLLKGRRTTQVHIDEVLTHPFLCLNESLYEFSEKKWTADGWRDDQFPRATTVRTSSLLTAQRVLNLGNHLFYGPKELIEEWGLAGIQPTGCPFECALHPSLVSSSVGENRVLQLIWEALQTKKLKDL